MFTNHFNLKAQPFLERAPIEQLQKDERMTEGIARLEYFSQAGTIAVVTGQTGVGKSTLIKLFLALLTRTRFHPVYLHITHVNAVAFLKLIVRSLDEVPKRGKENLFLQILDKAQSTESTTILIVDESHLADPQALIDLRLLISSALDDQPPLKLILTGQDSLWNLLRRASNTDFVQRISVRYHVPPLTHDQTAAYIDFQMRAAGGTDKVFEPEAKSLIHDYAGGIPRQINNVATACLINAAGKNLQKVTEPLVNETMGEFHLP